MSLTPALGKQRQVDLCEVYKVGSRRVRFTQKSPVSKSKNKQTNKYFKRSLGSQQGA